MTTQLDAIRDAAAEARHDEDYILGLKLLGIEAFSAADCNDPGMAGALDRLAHRVMRERMQLELHA